MATPRIDWKRVRQRLADWGRRIGRLAVRGFQAARHEASKDKYREYLSQAYADMRHRYPAVESKAKEALDAIGVKPRTSSGSTGAKSSRGPARKKSKKKTSGGTTRSKASAAKATGKKKTAKKKKAGTKKKVA
jgi:hypothetical protein